MTVRRESAEALTMPAYSRCSESKFRLQQEIGHSQNAIHGGANLVAHVSHKLALGVAGGFGNLLGLADNRGLLLHPPARTTAQSSAARRNKPTHPSTSKACFSVHQGGWLIVTMSSGPSKRMRKDWFLPVFVLFL